MFVTVPQQSFMLDVFKSWLVAIQWATPWVKVMPKHPDINEALELPVLVLTRGSDETMTLARNSGFYGYSENGWTGTTLERLEGYRYSSEFQLDIIARSNHEMIDLISKVQWMLMNPDGVSFVAEWFPWAWQVIPVKHFASVNSTWDATDLRICYKFREVSGTQVEWFDSEILQYSMTIPFWCDYMVRRDVDKLLVTALNPVSPQE